MQLVRSMTPPNTVHQPQCTVKGKRCEKWHYAVLRSLDEIRADTRSIPWLHLCKTCTGGCGCSRCDPAAWEASTR